MKSFKLFFIVLAFGCCGFCIVNLSTQKIIIKHSYNMALLSRLYNFSGRIRRGIWTSFKNIKLNTINL